MTAPVVLSGRCDVPQRGAHDAAVMVGSLGPAHPVRLIVQGAPPDTVRTAARLLSRTAGRPVEVRALHTDLDRQRLDIQAADLVLVPCRTERVGLTALDAVATGVPALLPDSCGVGAFLADSGRFSTDLVRHVVVRRRQGAEWAPPIERWTAEVEYVLTDLPRAKRNAAALRQEFLTALATLQSAGESFADLLSASHRSEEGE